MLIRRLCIRTSHVPTTMRALSLSKFHPVWRGHGSAKCLYGSAQSQLRFQEGGRQWQLLRTYSNYYPGGNYEPRGPPYYQPPPYGPPKSRASRLKDIALGAVLAVAIGFAYDFYDSRDLIREINAEEEYIRTLETVFGNYHQLLATAEAEDDGSAESAERIRRIFVERAIAITTAVEELDPRQIRDLGPLPSLSTDDESRSTNQIENKDTLVILPPQPAADEIAKTDELVQQDGSYPSHSVIAAVNASMTNLPNVCVPLAPKRAASDDTFRNLCQRLGTVLDKLGLEGIVDAHKPTVVTFILRDEIVTFYYLDGAFVLMGERLRVKMVWQD